MTVPPDQATFIPLPPLLPGRLLCRPNRFLAVVDVAGKETEAFVADPGRLAELLYPGAEVYLAPSAKEGRRTRFDLRLARAGEELVSVDSRVPNQLSGKLLRSQHLPPFAAYTSVQAEPKAGGGRFDFLLAGNGQPPCYLEVKSCTLVREGLALFPDAPTARGARHARELGDLVARGYRAAVMFMVQRRDALAFSPNDPLDPAFGLALRQAASAGVEIYAYTCHVTLERIALAGEIPVYL